MKYKVIVSKLEDGKHILNFPYYDNKIVEVDDENNIHNIARIEIINNILAKNTKNDFNVSNNLEKNQYIIEIDIIDNPFIMRLQKLTMCQFYQVLGAVLLLISTCFFGIYLIKVPILNSKIAINFFFDLSKLKELMAIFPSEWFKFLVLLKAMGYGLILLPLGMIYFVIYKEKKAVKLLNYIYLVVILIMYILVIYGYIKGINLIRNLPPYMQFEGMPKIDSLLSIGLLKIVTYIIGIIFIIKGMQLEESNIRKEKNEI